MATTNFTSLETVIQAEWANEVDALVHDVFGGATTDAAARTNLGVEIGTDVQAYDAQLATLAALADVSNLSDVAGIATTNNHVVQGDGANLVLLSGPTYVVKSGAYTAVDGDCIAVDTSGGAVTITLPASPTALKSRVSFTDHTSSFATNSLTIARNSLNIMSTAEDMTVSTNNAAFTLLYVSVAAGWVFI